MQKLPSIQNGAYLKAEESYCTIVFNDGLRHLKSRPMKHFVQYFQTMGWHRIHRSYMVNPEFVKQISTDRDTVFLLNGMQLPISRRQRKSVLKWRNSTI